MQRIVSMRPSMAFFASFDRPGDRVSGLFDATLRVAADVHRVSRRSSWTREVAGVDFDADVGSSAGRCDRPT